MGKSFSQYNRKISSSLLVLILHWRHLTSWATLFLQPLNHDFLVLSSHVIPCLKNGPSDNNHVSGGSLLDALDFKCSLGSLSV